MTVQINLRQLEGFPEFRHALQSVSLSPFQSYPFETAPINRTHWNPGEFVSPKVTQLARACLITPTERFIVFNKAYDPVVQESTRSKVKLAVSLKTGQIYVAKIIPTQLNLSDLNFRFTPSQLPPAFTKTQKLKGHCPELNLVEGEAFYLSGKKHRVNYIALSLFACGDLFTILHEKRFHFFNHLRVRDPDELTMRIAKAMTLHLQTWHLNRMIFCDGKEENYLIYPTEDNFRLALTDPESIIFDDNNREGCSITYRYLAPEQVSNLTNFAPQSIIKSACSKASQATDVWALGIAFLFMARCAPKWLLKRDSSSTLKHASGEEQAKAISLLNHTSDLGSMIFCPQGHNPHLYKLALYLLTIDPALRLDRFKTLVDSFV